MDKVNGVLTRMFSANGDLSSGRIGHYVGLVTLVVLISYDTLHNGKLDPSNAVILGGLGTMGYAITKDGYKATLTSTPVATPVAIPDDKEKEKETV